MTASNPEDLRPTLMQEWDGVLAPHNPAERDDVVTERLPIVARELIALPLIIALCDLTVYRSNGYTGLAALFAVAPLLLLLGIVRRKSDVSVWIVEALLILTSIRLVWCGSEAAVVAGFILLCGYAMGLSGARPHVLPGIVFASRLISAGHRGLQHYAREITKIRPNIPGVKWISVLLPIVTFVVFSAIFVLANPDLVKSFSSGMERIVEVLQRYLENFQLTEILFCFGVGWIGVGLLRPEAQQIQPDCVALAVTSDKANAPLYEAFRNSLTMVIGLFAIYLTFEFQTLWFRVFPKGFHYSGYAHEGAAWLTVALGLATLGLSVIFRGRILADPRLARLRLLSWIWSIENFLLAVSVFNRLFIYVGFNGMTRMRVIGLLGVASVVGGFLLVLVKIRRNYDFVWLIRRQLWVVTLAGYLYAVLPVDAFVNEYNVRRILAGDSAPSVQIGFHPTSAEGMLRLEPLLDCSDDDIRLGIRAMLAERLIQDETDAADRLKRGWTAIQWAERSLSKRLTALRPQLVDDTDSGRRAADLIRFRQYVYQWY